MQFRLIRLLAMTTACAVVLALYRLHPLAAVLACPVLLGPWAGRRACRSGEGALLGLLSAGFWSLAALLLYLLLGHLMLMLSFLPVGGGRPSIAMLAATYLFFALTSCAGGYLGGRMATRYGSQPCA